MAVIKIIGRNLSQYLRGQLEYFGIENFGNSLSSSSWVCVGYDPDPQSIIDKHNGIDVHSHWIRLVGFSRIDGYPIFQTFENYSYPIQDLISHVGLTMLNVDGNVQYIKDDFDVELIQMLEDHNIIFKNTIKPKGKQVFSLIDPYGEELWEDE